MIGARTTTDENEIINSILHEARLGAKVLPLAKKFGIPLHRVYHAAEEADIELIRGKAKFSDKPAQARKEFERRFGAGTAERFGKARASARSYADIGKMFGVSRQMAAWWDHMMHPEPKPRPKPVLRRSDITPQKIKRLAIKCRRLNDILRILNCDRVTLWRRARAHNIVLPDARGGSKEQKHITAEELQRCSEECRTLTEIGRRLNASPSTIWRRGRKLGVMLPADRRRTSAARNAVDVPPGT